MQRRTLLVLALVGAGLASIAHAETRADAFADALESDYVFPDIGARMARSIREADARGAYDALDDDALAQQLTEAARAISKDKHLYVKHGPLGRRAPPSGSHANPPRAIRRDDGIGVLVLDTLLDTVSTTDRIDDAMRALAGVEALVIDLRENRGGGGTAITDVAGWLYDEPMHLNDIYWHVDWSGRRGRTESFHTTPHAESTLVDVPVYVLISKKTFSAAEELAYDLQQTQRATLVGETSGGGAHPVRFYDLGSGLNASIPVARAINPVTKTNWEGVGVVPDVPTPLADALDRAVALASAAIRASRTSAGSR